MADTTITIPPADGNNHSNLPALAEQDGKSPYAYTEEYIQAVMDDYNSFQWEIHQKMQMYRKALSNLSSDLYKDVFKRLVGGDTMSFNHDSLFQGWHCHGYNACNQVKNGLDDMWFAFRQAMAYARAMQRPRG
jgi:hypothetical protein